MQIMTTLLVQVDEVSVGNLSSYKFRSLVEHLSIFNSYISLGRHISNAVKNKLCWTITHRRLFKKMYYWQDEAFVHQEMSELNFVLWS